MSCQLSVCIFFTSAKMLERWFDFPSSCVALMCTVSVIHVKSLERHNKCEEFCSVDRLLQYCVQFFS